MNEAQQIDTLVIGAGVVGLAAGAALARAGREVVLVEAEDGLGRHASSRNSEVIHAGFYYEPGSRKARHCLRGRALLLERAVRLGIPHAICGKLVVARDETELAKLEELRERGRENDVAGLAIVGREELRRLEPELHGVAALHSRGTGIVDSHALMLSLAAELEEFGGTIVYRSPVLDLADAEGRIEVAIGGAERMRLAPRLVVNAAGAGALALARRHLGEQAALPRIRLVRGHYLDHAGPSPFRHLVYPLPSRDGLGIHATLDLAGRLRFGPDTLEVTSLDYALAEGLVPAFAAAIRRYWPGLDERRLAGGYAGIRTKTAFADDRAPDFVLLGPSETGRPGVLHLLGIESPGLTAALSLAEELRNILL